MTAQRDSAPPDANRTGRKAKQVDASNHIPLGSTIKRLILRLALWGLLSPSAANWLINTLDLRGA